MISFELDTGDFLSVRLFGFDLNRRVVDAVIAATNLIYVFDATVAEGRAHVASEDVLAATQSPDMEVVQFLDGLEPLDGIEKFHGVDVIRSCLHDNGGAFEEDRYGSEEHKQREQVGADRIGDLPLGLALDDDGCGDDANRLHHVANNVYNGGTHVHVAFVIAGSFLDLNRTLLITEFVTFARLVVLLQ